MNGSRNYNTTLTLSFLGPLNCCCCFFSGSISRVYILWVIDLQYYKMLAWKSWNMIYGQVIKNAGNLDLINFNKLCIDSKTVPFNPLTPGARLKTRQWETLPQPGYFVQYRSKVSYHLASRFLRDAIRVARE